MGWRRWFLLALTDAFRARPTDLRATLAGCRVTIHEHLDQTVSITFGPHLVGRYNAAAGPLEFKPKPVEMVGKSGQKAA